MKNEQDTPVAGVTLEMLNRPAEFYMIGHARFSDERDRITGLYRVVNLFVKNPSYPKYPQPGDDKTMMDDARNQMVERRGTGTAYGIFYDHGAARNNNTIAAALLGSIKTPKKAAASRVNGKKGGRPKNYANRAYSPKTIYK